EPAAATAAQPVPAADRVDRGPAPRLHRAVGGGLLLVGRAQRDPVALFLQPGVQVLDGPQPVLQRGRADLADQRGRIGLLVLVHGVAGGARRGLQLPRVLLRAGGHTPVERWAGGRAGTRPVRYLFLAERAWCAVMTSAGAAHEGRGAGDGGTGVHEQVAVTEDGEAVRAGVDRHDRVGAAVVAELLGGSQ